MDEIMAWVQAHRDQGHAADPTVVGAPGIGRGSWCHTCREYGPSTVRILTLEEVE